MTARPTACSTVPPPSRGSTTGTATSSPSASASSGARRTAWSRPPATATAAAPAAAGAGGAGRRHPAGPGLRRGRRRRAGRRADHLAAARRRAPAVRWPGSTGSPPPSRRPRARCSPSRPGRRHAGTRTRWTRWGSVPWDRFQTLAGIQYYFDTEFQLVRGHVYYSGTEWGLSSINQQGLWERRPTLARDGYVSVLSVDIGDFNTPSRAPGRRARAGQGRTRLHGRRARRGGVAPDRRGRSPASVDNVAGSADAVARVVCARPQPGLGRRSRPGQRPPDPQRGALPDPHRRGLAESARRRALEPATARPGSPGRPSDSGCEDLEQRNVWQARHGGYQVHNNSVVFAGTWTKTFTRMTSMEAACESARHAVNADPGSLRLGGVGWRRPSGKDRARLADPVRLPRPGLLQPGPACPHRPATTASSSTSRTASPSTPAPAQPRLAVLPSIAPAPSGHRGPRPAR